MVYDPAAYKLTLKGGVNLRFDHVDELRSYARYATRVQDTNGNYIDIAYADYGGRISSIQDTLGNTYSFLLNSNGRLQYLKYWNTNDVSQATSTITFSYLTQNAVFGAGATTDPVLPSQGMLTHVTYPTGLHYDFISVERRNVGDRQPSGRSGIYRTIPLTDQGPNVPSICVELRYGQ
jgi:hypothetical protein